MVGAVRIHGMVVMRHRRRGDFLVIVACVRPPRSVHVEPIKELSLRRQERKKSLIRVRVHREITGLLECRKSEIFCLTKLKRGCFAGFLLFPQNVGVVDGCRLSCVSQKTQWVSLFGVVLVGFDVGCFSQVDFLCDKETWSKKRSPRHIIRSRASKAFWAFWIRTYTPTGYFEIIGSLLSSVK